jgi:hypothetical protein
MNIKYTYIYHTKALQNLPIFGIFGFVNKPSGNPVGKYGTLLKPALPKLGCSVIETFFTSCANELA